VISTKVGVEDGNAMPSTGKHHESAKIPLLGKLSLGASIVRRVWYKTSPYTMKKGGIYSPGDDEIGREETGVWKAKIQQPVASLPSFSAAEQETKNSHLRGCTGSVPQ